MMARVVQKKAIPLWKRIQKKKKKRRVLAFLFAFLVFWSLSLFFYSSKNFFHFLTTPLEPKKCHSFRTSNANRVNILFDYGDLILFSLDKEKGEIAGMIIPGNLYRRRNKEIYRLGAFFELGRMKDGCGGRFLKREIEALFLLPVDRYIHTENFFFTQENWKEGFVRVRSWFWPLWFAKNVFLPQKIVTDLSFWEILKLWWRAKSVRKDKFSLFTLKKVSFPYLLPDGTKIEIVDLEKIPPSLGGRFRDGKIEKERMAVAVFNTTQKRGEAQRAGRLIQNLGGNLVHIGNWPIDLGENQIWVGSKKERGVYTTKRLAEIFRAKILVRETEERRGDILLLLGEK